MSMRARQLIDSASYGPDVLKIVYQAFDEAWSAIEGNFGDDPATIEAAGIKLAKIILTFPPEKIRDAQQVKNSALQVMALDFRNRSTTTTNTEVCCWRLLINCDACSNKVVARWLTWSSCWKRLGAFA